jgi:hypothetical protein
MIVLAWIAKAIIIRQKAGCGGRKHERNEETTYRICLALELAAKRRKNTAHGTSAELQVGIAALGWLAERSSARV